MQDILARQAWSSYKDQLQPVLRRRHWMTGQRRCANRGVMGDILREVTATRKTIILFIEDFSRALACSLDPSRSKKYVSPYNDPF